MIETLKERGDALGYVAPKLVDPSSVFQVAFLSDEPRLRPASLIIANLLPLEIAFEHMDRKGPLKTVAYDWLRKTRRQFALQEINKGTEEGDRNEREYARGLASEPMIKELLCSRRPVMLLSPFWMTEKQLQRPLFFHHPFVF